MASIAAQDQKPASSDDSLPMPAAPAESPAYGSVFWLAYLANASTMIAVSLLVRYADFVTFLGGAEGRLGLIVGVGMIGSLAMRLAQGTSIDRYGPRAIWLGSLATFVASLLVHLWVQQVDGPGIFLARIIMQTSIAGIFGASITYMSLRVPPARMAEMIGTLGTSGFVGLLVGPQLADRIIGNGAVTRGQLDQLFLTAAALGGLALVAAWAATRGVAAAKPRRRVPILAVLRRYHPGSMMLVAAAVGAGIGIPNTFLRTFAAERGISQIGLFFTTYALVAFAVRMSTRHLFQRVSNVVWVLTGLFSISISILLYLLVHETWQFIFPGISAGIAHALLFPAVVAGGSTAFPERYRGLGTTLMLAMFDVGALIGSPLVGGLLSAARWAGIPAYPATFLTVAAALTGIGIYFGIASARQQPRVPAAARRRAQPPAPHHPVPEPADYACVAARER